MKNTIYIVDGKEFELQHHGVKGMKWGVRKERNSPNPNYSEQQRLYDRAMYGKRSEKRINRRLNDGENIKTARHHEVERRERIQKVERGAKAVASVLGTVGTWYVYDLVYNQGAGARAVKNTVRKIAKGRL